MSGFLGKTISKFVSNQTSKLQNLSNSINQHQQQHQIQDTQLTLAHLRKVFYEYLHPRVGTSIDQTQNDDKLYSILPLFIKAFSQVQSLNDINDKFTDCAKFCQVCSQLLVNEISKRSHDDLILVKYFEAKSNDESHNDGYTLLQVINLLSLGPSFLIDIIAQSTLPSRLVMCLYLFICLPEPKDSILEFNVHSQLNANDRRSLFHKVFNQLLIKLCNFKIVAQQLCDSDSIKHLFSIITSSVDVHNVCWRQTANEALASLAKNLTIDNITLMSRS
jgi:hypothetical protein